MSKDTNRIQDAMARMREDGPSRYVNGASSSELERIFDELGYHKRTRAMLILEREQAIEMLRIVCADYGDLEWDRRLHLADIIDKHLYRCIDG